MSHERDTVNSQEQHTFYCDLAGCDEEFRERGDFNECWDLAKQDGWRCRKEANEWRHYCPEHTRST